jgi:hypothetical protein
MDKDVKGFVVLIVRGCEISEQLWIKTNKGFVVLIVRGCETCKQLWIKTMSLLCTYFLTSCKETIFTNAHSFGDIEAFQSTKFYSFNILKPCKCKVWDTRKKLQVI